MKPLWLLRKNMETNANNTNEPVCEKCGRVYCDHENKY